MVWSKRDTDPNSSPMLGALKPSPKEPRSSTFETGRQRRPNLEVVSLPKVL